MPDTPETVLKPNERVARVKAFMEAFLPPRVGTLPDDHWLARMDGGEKLFVNDILALLELSRTPSSAKVSELVERLNRKLILHLGPPRGRVEAGLLNPDGPEAATALETLEARVKVLTSEVECSRADALEEAAKIAESHAYCGCNGKHGACMADDTPKAIAADIRAALLKQLSGEGE